MGGSDIWISLAAVIASLGYLALLPSAAGDCPEFV
jgi:hypothetical protein